jgi:hypothetical protein
MCATIALLILYEGMRRRPTPLPFIAIVPASILVLPPLLFFTVPLPSSSACHKPSSVVDFECVASSSLVTEMGGPLQSTVLDFFLRPGRLHADRLLRPSCILQKRHLGHILLTDP